MTKAQRSATHQLRLSRALALTAALGLSLSMVACTAQESPDDTENSATPSASASAPASSAPPTSSPSPTSAGTPKAAPSKNTPKAAPSKSAPAASTALCTAASLTGSLGDNGGAGAGQLYRSLILTNTSAADCILDGYPGVSLIMAGTTSPIGEPAVRDPQAPSNGPITLTPGSAAAATLHYTQAGNYQECQHIEANAILVYPPSATDSLEVPTSLTACSNAGINLLTIGAFQQ